MVDEAFKSFTNLMKRTVQQERRDTSFQLKELKSALKKFAMQYRIDGKDVFDPDLFLVNVKQSITKLLISRR